MVLRDWAVDALLAAVARTFVFWGQLEGAWAWWMQLWAYGWLATFLAGCASKFEGRCINNSTSNSAKCYPSIPIPELSLPPSPQFVPTAINRSHFFGPS